MTTINHKTYGRICKGGNIFYYLDDGKPFDSSNYTYHREDGPAIECGDGRKYWYINGKRHRIDGPAVEFVNGNKQYYLNGKCYSFEEWDRLRKLPWLL